jgi:hypothetical protein
MSLQSIAAEQDPLPYSNENSPPHHTHQHINPIQPPSQSTLYEQLNIMTAKKKKLKYEKLTLLKEMDTLRNLLKDERSILKSENQTLKLHINDIEQQLRISNSMIQTSQDAITRLTSQLQSAHTNVNEIELERKKEIQDEYIREQQRLGELERLRNDEIDRIKLMNDEKNRWKQEWITEKNTIKANYENKYRTRQSELKQLEAKLLKDAEELRIRWNERETQRQMELQKEIERLNGKL